jgi:hypothetical protein
LWPVLSTATPLFVPNPMPRRMCLKHPTIYLKAGHVTFATFNRGKRNRRNTHTGHWLHLAHRSDWYLTLLSRPLWTTRFSRCWSPTWRGWTSRSGRSLKKSRNELTAVVCLNRSLVH